jgi:hypothetical protein
MEWEVSKETGDAWEQLICRRARFVAQNMVVRLLALCSR